MADAVLNAGDALQARRLATEYAVSRLLAEGDDSVLTLRRALAVMGQKLRFDYCVCWRLSGDGETMRVAAGWQRHPERTQQLAQHGQSILLRPGKGFAGRAWKAGSPIWIDDVAQDPDFLSADAATAAGLAAAVCCPVFIRGDVVGLLQLIAAAGIVPDTEALPVLTSLSSQIGQFLDRDAIRAELSASEARYRALFTENVAGVHLSTIAGKPVAVNPAFEKMFGFESTDEALAADTRELYADVADRAALLEELRRNGRDCNRQLRLRRRDGSIFWVLANTVFIPGQNGDPDLNESTLIDITETKDLERRLWQTTKLEGIGRLAGGIAHDFNNLLTVINGYSELLLAKLPGAEPLRDHAAKIRQAGMRAEALTRQLMAFSRQQAAQPAVLNLAVAVRDSLALLEGSLHKGIEISVRAEPGLAPVYADPGHIGQIVMNLVLNARDAMPQGGHLMVELNTVEVKAEYARRHIQSHPGSFVQLAVSDTGAGMDAETRSHLFEPFFTTKGEGKGHGLGLSTAYGLVLQNGGWIEVYSEPGHGSTFKVYLPPGIASDAPILAPQSAPAVEVAADPAGVRVLIAEDEAEVRTLVEEVLGEAGYKLAASAADGARAVALAEAAGIPLDLLVTDVIMPGRNGPEVAAWLWQREPAARVLFISGYSEQAVLQQGLLPERKVGVDYLQKPFSPEALKAKVAALLRSGGS